LLLIWQLRASSSVTATPLISTLVAPRYVSICTFVLVKQVNWVSSCAPRRASQVCQYLYFCTSKTFVLVKQVNWVSSCARHCDAVDINFGSPQVCYCQFLYFCTSKTSRLSP
jgi:hypothetical protein